MRSCLRFSIAMAMAVLALAACSNPTGGTAAPGTGAFGTTGPPQSSAAVAEPAVTPQITTLTVTATASPAPTTSTSAVMAAPAAPPTDLSGEVHGFVTAVDVGAAQLTVDKVDWFTGAAAQQACAEDGITSTDNNRCIGYYYRNVNPMLRVIAVSPHASISTLSTQAILVPGDLTSVAARVATTQGSGLYDFTVTDGLVTELQEMYFP